MRYDHSLENIKKITDMVKRMRLDAIDMTMATGTGGAHLGGGLSAMEILAVLYSEVLRVDPKEPLKEDRDIFLPSKNHCVLAHLPALCERGFFAHDELFEFQKNGGRLTGYPRRPEIGLEYSGGSLGMAISVGIGLALSSREKGFGSDIYVLMGDGELNEGSIWEAFMSAAHYRLSNLVAIIDRNHLSYDGDTEEVMSIDSLTDKMKAFNWHVVNCDGHDVSSLLDAFEDRGTDRPTVIIAETVKGKGVSFIENRPEWHHHALTAEQYDIAKREILEGQV